MAQLRSERIRTVLLLVEGYEQEAAKQLRDARDRLAREREQLTQLDDYLQQYQTEMSQRRQGVHADELMAFSDFVRRINTARAEQGEKIHRQAEQVEAAQAHWRERHHRRRAIEDLVARLRDQENQDLEKQLQRELDELVSQRYSWQL